MQRHRRRLSFVLNVSIGAMVVTQCVNHEKAQRFAGYEEVVRSLQAGDLRPNADGVIRLPARWAWLTEEGRVYRSHDEQNGVQWLFPTSVEVSHVNISGINREFRAVTGYIYSLEQPEARYLSFHAIECVYPRQSKPAAQH